MAASIRLLRPILAVEPAPSRLPDLPCTQPPGLGLELKEAREQHPNK